MATATPASANCKGLRLVKGKEEQSVQDSISCAEAAKTSPALKL